MQKVRIGFPTKCRYRGGNRTLGARGRHLWIEEGRIGHGLLRLSRWIPIETVRSVAVSERMISSVERRGPLIAQGLLTARLTPKGTSKLLTDVFVATSDGQIALWVIEQRDADWVRHKLAPVLKEQQIPLDYPTDDGGAGAQPA